MSVLCGSATVMPLSIGLWIFLVLLYMFGVICASCSSCFDVVLLSAGCDL